MRAATISAGVRLDRLLAKGTQQAAVCHGRTGAAHDAIRSIACIVVYGEVGPLPVNPVQVIAESVHLALASAAGRVRRHAGRRRVRWVGRPRGRDGAAIGMGWGSSYLGTAKDPKFREKFGPRGVLHTWADGEG
jgi:hypothetical protein